ncbi:MAG: hypothetical protein MI924_39525 [Chloroflexales bacterium]|nr:hypothetical protein [Chloroflexales bacterium]
MDSHIGHMHCRYRVIGTHSAAAATADLLDRLARDRVLQAWSDALDQALGDDQAVYVLRWVKARMAVVLDDHLTDTQLAQRWGQNLAGAVMRAIASSASDSDLVRFANQADYVASFVADLLQGLAWQRWFYNPFAALRSLDIAEALRTVLLDNRDYLPVILGALHHRGMLGRLLAVLDDANLQQLWSHGLGAVSIAEPAALRPLFAAALSLLDRLDLWADARPASEALFREYLSTHPAPADWRDRRGLAAALLAAWRFLALRGYLRQVDAVMSHDVAANLDRALADFDWLDIAWFKDAVGDLLTGAADQPASMPQTDLLVDPQHLQVDTPAVEPEAMYPLVAYALQLLDRLDLLVQPQPASETLLKDFMATRPAPADWRDRQRLTAAFIRILDFLLQRGVIRRLDGAERDAVRGRLEGVIADYDWLDMTKLQVALLEVLSDSQRRPAAPLPTRSARSGPTPRQRDLLAELADVLRDGIPMNRSQPVLPANALLWYAALINHSPRWAGDPIATGMIQRLLEAWNCLARSHAPQAALQRLQQGDIAGVAQTLPEREREAAGATLDVLLHLGGLALNLLATLLNMQADTPAIHRTSPRSTQNMPAASRSLRSSVSPVASIETGCAGVFLLLRTLLDARLTELVARASLPHQGSPDRLGALLVALGLRWAGAPGLVDGQLDGGLAILSGLDQPVDLAGLHETLIQSLDDALLQVELLRLLAGQRLIRGPELHLYYPMLPNGARVLAAGSEATGLWLPGKIIGATDDIAQTISDWQAVWAGLTGQPLTVILDETLLAALPDVVRTADLLIAPETVPAGDGVDKKVSLHHASRQALLAMLPALEAPWPDRSDAALPITLIANALLRAWARWLQRGFATSSAPYLLDNFIRRPGRVLMDATSITVEMESRPFDVVIGMAGYTADLEQIAWLGRRCVRFRLQR